MPRCMLFYPCFGIRKKGLTTRTLRAYGLDLPLWVVGCPEFSLDMIRLYASENDFPSVGSKLFRWFKTGVENADFCYRVVFPDCVGCFLSERPATI